MSSFVLRDHFTSEILHPDTKSPNLPYISRHIHLKASDGKWHRRYIVSHNQYLLGYRFSFFAPNNRNQKSKRKPNIAINLSKVVQVSVCDKFGNIVSQPQSVSSRYIQIETLAGGCSKTSEFTHSGRATEYVILGSKTAIESKTLQAALEQRIERFKKVQSEKTNYYDDSEDSDDDYLAGMVTARDLPSIAESSTYYASLGRELFVQANESKPAPAKLSTKNSLDAKYWADGDYKSAPLRGKYYMTDKVKIGGSPPVFDLVTVDFFSSDSKMDNICNRNSNRVRQYLDKLEKVDRQIFVINFQLPGPPYRSAVLYFQIRDEDTQIALFGSDLELEQSANAQDKLNTFPPGYRALIREFFLGKDDTLRDDRLKLIPYIVDGPWIIQKSVGHKPALIGRKLKQQCFRQDGCLEIDLDVAVDALACQLTKLSVGYARNIVVDLGFTIEGRDESTLPEILLGIGRIDHLDIKATTPFV